MRSPGALSFLILLLLAPAPLLEAKAPPNHRILMPQSVVPLPPKAVLLKRPLTSSELAAPLEFEIALKMRNFSRFQARVSRNAKVEREELEREHLPLAASHDALVHWLIHEGFTITSIADNRLAVFAVGSIDQIQRSFQVSFGPVTVEGITYSAAIDTPSLPDSLAPFIVGINGLQPFLKMRKRPMLPNATSTNSPPYLVSDILGAYNAKNLGVTGSGQKIAILIDTVPANSDLTSFWSNNSISQSLSQIEEINVNGVTLSAPSGEETLDTEWSSGIASGAGVRIYAAGSLQFTDLDKAIQRLISDLPSQPQIHQLSISLGLGETYLASSSQMQTDAQYFATLANGGVSTFVSSGDAGSNPTNTGATGGPLQVEYYASDPSVTGVGGTSLTLSASTGAVSSETAWNGSGGGISQTFARPSWQAGPGVITGTMRLVPDVCAAADPNTGAYVILNGSVQQYGGTSWSAPVWAGFSALINEARAKAGLAPVGLYNPNLYPLIGTGNFRDITSGNNGAYNAGAGYDMVTGIGSPNVANLMQTLAGSGSGAPVVTGFSPSSGLRGDSVVISGLNFSGATAVGFNGVGASFSINSSLQITATVPQTATTGPLTVTSAAGTGTSSGPFSVVLSTGTLPLYSSGFEPGEGFPLATGSQASASSPKLSGVNSWTVSGSGGQGLLAGALSGSGQQGFLGFTSQGTNKNDVVIWRPVNDAPVSGDVIHFGVNTAIVDSSNGNYDRFYWSAYNASGHRFFSVFFDNSNNNIGTISEGGALTTVLSAALVNGHVYDLEVAMNFSQNTWSATLDGTPLAASQPITSGTFSLDFGYMAAAWHLLARNPPSWGNNYMVFDNYSIGRSNSTLPLYSVSVSAMPANLGTVAGSGTFFSGDSAAVVATSGSGAAFVKWTENGNAVSSLANYPFQVTGNRALAANFQPTLYSAWVATWFTPLEQATPSISGVSADPDQDGIVNLLEYACNRNPRVPDPGSLPTQTGIENGYLTLTYTRSKTASDVTFIPEVSSDLLNWSSGASYVSSPTVLSDDGFTQILKVSDLTPTSSANRRFIRLRVIEP